MKNLLLVIIVALLITSCTNHSKNEYSISGKISGKVPSQAFLQTSKDDKIITLDSSDFVNNKFKFTGSVTFPDLYYIQIGTSNNKISLFIENSQITVVANIDSLKKAHIYGSKTQDEYNIFNNSKAKYKKQQDKLYTDYKKAKTKELKKEIENIYDSIDSEKNEHIKNYIITNPNSALSPYIIRSELIYSMNLEELTKITNSLSPELQDNKYTKELYARILLLRNLEPGMIAPEFTQNNVEDSTINLSNFKGKYLLIDFWASWCVPCRQANPTIVAMYKKYKGKGFAVLGVSMDNSKEKWIKAIEEDNLIWEQVSSLQGWKNPVGKLYAVNSIPHAILIDPNGKIVKRGIHADELDGILSELMK